MNEAFDCQYETLINSFGGRSVCRQRVLAPTAEEAIAKLRQELESLGMLPLSISAEGGDDRASWTREGVHPFERDL